MAFEKGRNERLLEVIRTQTEIAKVGLDLGGVMALVARRAQELTGASGAVVELAEGEEMVYRAASGVAEKQLGLRLRRDGSLSGLCVKTGEPMVSEDTALDPRVDRAACERVGLRSMVVAPLRHNDNLVGVLKVLAGVPHAFGPEDVETLQLMSELIAAAMYHATQYQASGLFHQATHDALTGLPNRALFYDRLRHGLARAGRASERLGILFLDMDGLKPINDHFGHKAGDAALRQVAARLRKVSRQSDTVARLGGDEFGVVLTHVFDRAGVATHAERMAESIAAPFELEGQPIQLGASVGSALFPEDGQEVEVLIDKADQAMYREKRGRERRV
jgi:diguanylate cyclase (GGDEF)-like protein